MSRAQEQFRKLNERLLPNQPWPSKVTPLIIILELVWIGVIFSLIIAGILTGIIAFMLLVVGLMVPAVLIQKLKKRFDQASPPPASDQIIDHDKIKTDKDGSPFVD